MLPTSNQEKTSYSLFQDILQANNVKTPVNEDLRDAFAHSLIRMAVHVAAKKSKSFSETVDRQYGHNVMDFDTCFSAAMEAVVKILNNPAQYAANDEKEFHKKCRSLMHKEIINEWRFLTHRGKAEGAISLDAALAPRDDRDCRDKNTAQERVARHFATIDRPNSGDEMRDFLHNRVVPTAQKLCGTDSRTMKGLEGLVQACREHIERREVAARLGITPSALSQQQADIREKIAMHAPNLSEELRNILADQQRDTPAMLKR